MEKDIDGILELLRLHHSADALDILETKEKAGLDQIKAGEKSEQAVVLALTELPIVDKVHETKTRGSSDRKGIDLVIDLKSETNKVRRVKVQVKSSALQIIEFKREIARTRRIPRANVDRWMLDNHWVILNGTLSAKNIVADFNSQLNAMNSRFPQPKSIAQQA